MKSWNGGNLEGWWLITRKLDGVQVIIKNGKAISRRNKLLHNVPRLKNGQYECFCKDWNTTVSMVRTHNGKKINAIYFYRIDHEMDARLYVRSVINRPTAELIKFFLDRALAKGDEGLVLHPWPQVFGNEKDGRVPLKVKPSKTYDVKVIGIHPGKGRNAGKVGALITPMGKVGAGLTDKDRARKRWIGETIEVESRGLTKNGKFKEPRYVRRRWDK